MSRHRPSSRVMLALQFAAMSMLAAAWVGVAFQTKPDAGDPKSAAQAASAAPAPSTPKGAAQPARPKSPPFGHGPFGWG